MSSLNQRRLRGVGGRHNSGLSATSSILTSSSASSMFLQPLLSPTTSEVLSNAALSRSRASSMFAGTPPPPYTSSPERSPSSRNSLPLTTPNNPPSRSASACEASLASNSSVPVVGRPGLSPSSTLSLQSTPSRSTSSGSSTSRYRTRFTRTPARSLSIHNRNGSIPNVASLSLPPFSAINELEENVAGTGTSQAGGLAGASAQQNGAQEEDTHRIFPDRELSDSPGLVDGLDAEEDARQVAEHVLKRYRRRWLSVTQWDGDLHVPSELQDASASEQVVGGESDANNAVMEGRTANSTTQASSTSLPSLSKYRATSEAQERAFDRLMNEAYALRQEVGKILPSSGSSSHPNSSTWSASSSIHQDTSAALHPLVLVPNAVAPASRPPFPDSPAPAPILSPGHTNAPLATTPTSESPPASSSTPPPSKPQTAIPSSPTTARSRSSPLPSPRPSKIPVLANSNFRPVGAKLMNTHGRNSPLYSGFITAGSPTASARSKVMAHRRTPSKQTLSCGVGAAGAGAAVASPATVASVEEGAEMEIPVSVSSTPSSTDICEQAGEEDVDAAAYSASPDCVSALGTGLEAPPVSASSGVADGHPATVTINHPTEGAIQVPVKIPLEALASIDSQYPTGDDTSVSDVSYLDSPGTSTSGTTLTPRHFLAQLPKPTPALAPISEGTGLEPRPPNPWAPSLDEQHLRERLPSSEIRQQSPTLQPYMVHGLYDPFADDHGARDDELSELMEDQTLEVTDDDADDDNTVSRSASADNHAELYSPIPHTPTRSDSGSSLFLSRRPSVDGKSFDELGEDDEPEPPQPVCDGTESGDEALSKLQKNHLLKIDFNTQQISPADSTPRPQKKGKHGVAFTVEVPKWNPLADSGTAPIELEVEPLSGVEEEERLEQLIMDTPTKIIPSMSSSLVTLDERFAAPTRTAMTPPVPLPILVWSVPPTSEPQPTSAKHVPKYKFDPFAPTPQASLDLVGDSHVAQSLVKDLFSPTQESMTHLGPTISEEHTQAPTHQARRQLSLRSYALAAQREFLRAQQEREAENERRRAEVPSYTNQITQSPERMTFPQSSIPHAPNAQVPATSFARTGSQGPSSPWRGRDGLHHILQNLSGGQYVLAEQARVARQHPTTVVGSAKPPLLFTAQPTMSSSSSTMQYHLHILDDKAIEYHDRGPQIQMAVHEQEHVAPSWHKPPSTLPVVESDWTGYPTQETALAGSDQYDARPIEVAALPHGDNIEPAQCGQLHDNDLPASTTPPGTPHRRESDMFREAKVTTAQTMALSLTSEYQTWLLLCSNFWEALCIVHGIVYRYDDCVHPGHLNPPPPITASYKSHELSFRHHLRQLVDQICRDLPEPLSSEPFFSKPVFPYSGINFRNWFHQTRLWRLLRQTLHQNLEEAPIPPIWMLGAGGEGPGFSPWTWRQSRFEEAQDAAFISKNTLDANTRRVMPTNQATPVLAPTRLASDDSSSALSSTSPDHTWRDISFDNMISLLLIHIREALRCASSGVADDAFVGNVLGCIALMDLYMNDVRALYPHLEDNGQVSQHLKVIDVLRKGLRVYSTVYHGSTGFRVFFEAYASTALTALEDFQIRRTTPANSETTQHSSTPTDCPVYPAFHAPHFMALWEAVQITVTNSLQAFEHGLAISANQEHTLARNHLEQVTPVVEAVKSWLGNVDTLMEDSLRNLTLQDWRDHFARISKRVEKLGVTMEGRFMSEDSFSKEVRKYVKSQQRDIAQHREHLESIYERYSALVKTPVPTEPITPVESPTPCIEEPVLSVPSAGASAFPLFSSTSHSSSSPKASTFKATPSQRRGDLPLPAISKARSRRPRLLFNKPKFASCPVDPVDREFVTATTSSPDGEWYKIPRHDSHDLLLLIRHRARAYYLMISYDTYYRQITCTSSTTDA